MRKILVFALIAILSVTANSCSNGGDEGVVVNRITFVVDGLRKDLYGITVDQSGSETILVKGQIGSEVIESIEFEVKRDVTGTSAITSMIFTQNNVQYYSFQGGGAYLNVSSNGDDRKIRGDFEGTFRTISGSSKLIQNGSFVIAY